MSIDLAFDRAPPAQAGQMLELAPGIRRIIADNPGPFTFTGTCTYIVGRGRVSVIDPGPEDPAHIASLLAALKGEEIGEILVTHTHRDHSPGARLLQAATGAPILGAGPHRASRPPLPGEETRLDASADQDHVPDRQLHEGMRVEAAEHVFEVIETPGHTANHLAFALLGRDMVFCGDHVMAWSTTIVAPPDGAMLPYLASLEKLLAREDSALWPGHGGPVAEPKRFIRALLSHRRQRETQILERLAIAPHTIPDLVAANYPAIDPRLKGAAGLSVYAHLEALIARGEVVSEGELGVHARFARV